MAKWLDFQLVTVYTWSQCVSMKTILNEIDNRLSLQPPLVAKLPFINKTSPEYPFYDNLYGLRHSCY